MNFCKECSEPHTCTSYSLCRRNGRYPEYDGQPSAEHSDERATLKPEPVTPKTTDEALLAAAHPRPTPGIAQLAEGIVIVWRRKQEEIYQEAERRLRAIVEGRAKDWGRSDKAGLLARDALLAAQRRHDERTRGAVTVVCTDCRAEVYLPEIAPGEVAIERLNGWTAPPPRCPRCSAGEVRAEVVPTAAPRDWPEGGQAGG